MYRLITSIVCWKTISLMYVTSCVLTNSFFRERRGFGATVQGKIKEGINRAQPRDSLGTFYEQLGTFFVTSATMVSFCQLMISAN